MPFGLSKSDKRPETEDEAPTETVEGSDDASTPNGLEDAGDIGGAGADAPVGDGQKQEGAAYEPMAFRPAFLDDSAPREAAPRPTPAPTGDAFFVSVTREEAPAVRRFDDPQAAQAFVEELLQEGVPQEEVTAFSGHKLAFRVSHRPIVKLFSGQEE